MSLLRSAATVGGATLASRVLGFTRDILIAAAIGTGPVADAFFVAFRLPNMFRAIFAEGAFNSAFVPLFSKRLQGEGKQAAQIFAEEAISVLLATLLVLTVAAMAGMAYLMLVLAPGFRDQPEKMALAIEYGRITFPYLLFISLTALQAAVLNSLGRFFAGAAAPILLNIVLISVLVAALPFFPSAGLALSWGVAAAGVAQFVFLTVACMRAGVPMGLRRPRLTPGVKRLIKLGVPGLISGGINQVNLVIGTMIASLQAGAVSWLYYADRIYQLPLGVVGIAIGIVLLPDLSKRLRAEDHAGAAASQNRAIEISMMLTLPAAVALAIIPYQIITVLFERGAFDGEDSLATAAALMAYAFGLPAFVLNKVFAPGYFAREDTLTPLKFAATSIAVNIASSIGLFYLFGYVGIACGTTIAAWVNTGLLSGQLYRLGHLKPDARLARRLPLLLLASLGMGAILWFGARYLHGWLETSAYVAQELIDLSVLGGLILAGLIAFALFCQLTGAMTVSELKRSLRG